MHPCVLSTGDAEANLQRRKHIKYFVRILLQIAGCEPFDANVLAHLNLRRQSVASKYDLVDVKVAVTFLALSIEVTLGAGDIMADNPLDWLVLIVLGEKRHLF